MCCTMRVHVQGSCISFYDKENIPLIKFSPFLQNETFLYETKCLFRVRRMSWRVTAWKEAVWPSGGTSVHITVLLAPAKGDRGDRTRHIIW